MVSRLRPVGSLALNTLVCASVAHPGRYRRRMQADEALAAGVELRAPVIKTHGFTFVSLARVKGSGGWSASGEFRRERAGELRRLELHFRNSLGLVTYHVDSTALSHADYMRALNARNEYPGFSDDPLDGFRHLLHDLERYAGDFLDGPGDEFARCVHETERFDALSGFKRLSETS
jgi:hypothetical protein